MEIIYMKTSIIKLSVNEALCVNGGVSINPFINPTEILSTGKELIFNHPKQISAIGIGGAILTVVSVVAKFSLDLMKENAAANILRETIKLVS